MNNQNQKSKMKTPSQGLKNWEKEFNVAFDHYNPIHANSDGTGEHGGLPVWNAADFKNIKDFIRRVRKEAMREILGEVATMERGIEWMQEGDRKDRKGYTDGYNTALADVTQKLLEEIEND